MSGYSHFLWIPIALAFNDLHFARGTNLAQKPLYSVVPSLSLFAGRWWFIESKALLKSIVNILTAMQLGSPSN